MAGSSYTPTSSIVFTTTGGAGNADTVTFGSDASYVEIVNLGSVRISVMIDPGQTNPTIDGDGTITVPPGGSVIEQSLARASTVVKVIASSAVDVAVRTVAAW